MRRRAMVLVLFVAGVCLLAFAGTAQAETIEVTTTADPAVSTCPGAECSLRQAVTVANTEDTIQLEGSSEHPDEYKLTQGSQIVVSKSLTIRGNGTSASILDGSANKDSKETLNRIMKVTNGIVRIEGMKFTRGFDGADEGLEGCSPCETLRANGGGALYNAGAAVELENVIFEGDGVSSGEPTGGAIGNAGTLDLRNVSFPDDNAAIGGALFSRGGQINAENVTFENDGTSAFDGGAVFLFNGGNASFTNTTVVGSGWPSSFGGGIDNSGSTLTLTNDTFSGNIRGALETDTGGSTSVQNTILGSGFSDNADFDCVGEGKGTDVNTTTAKAITNDLGNNIDQDGVCGLNASGDKSKVDPKLAPIADNGGLTPTQALLHGSPAIDAGSLSACPASDQRGVAHPLESCDIGAFEAVLHGPPVVATVAATGVAATEATLRATVELAGEAGSYHFLWGTSPSELTNETPEVGAGVISTGTVESEKLPGLSTEKTYYFQAVADNASGSATAGNLISFTTASESAGEPVISNVTVASRTETTATIEFTIDPNGAEASYVISYGPSSAYGQQTEPVSIGPTPGSKRLQRMLTGLEPHRTYHFRVLATNFKGTVSSQDQQFVTDLPAATTASASSPGTVTQVPGPLPPPVLGKTANVELVSGTVLIALPPTAQASLARPLETAVESLNKGLKFIPLTEARQIPVGSTLDTTAGVARITTATAKKGQIQFGDFGAGIFKLLQNRTQKGLTQLNLIDRLSPRAVCTSVGKGHRASAAKHLSSKVLGQLNSSDHGKFSARGDYSAATVRGTVYSIKDTCAGTITKVTRGVVAVRDFRKRKTIVLSSGHSYLAKAPGA